MMRHTRHINFMVMTLAYGVSGLLMSGILEWILDVFKVPEGIVEILLVIAIGLLSFLGTCFLLLALKFEEAGTVLLTLIFRWLLIFNFLI